VKTLWAPWRMPYIKSVRDDDGGCFFCAYLKQKKDAKNLILARGRTCFAILNRFPYNPGHLMIAPNEHKAELAELTTAELAELLGQARDMQDALARSFKPHGYNLGINLGRVAGAGVLGHIHLHVVPRWNGDTNFMPVTGGTKVMPISLAETWRTLQRALKSRR
jgi:ATP adenylyltransferase